MSDDRTVKMTVTDRNGDAHIRVTYQDGSEQTTVTKEHDVERWRQLTERMFERVQSGPLPA